MTSKRSQREVIWHEVTSSRTEEDVKVERAQTVKDLQAKSRSYWKISDSCLAGNLCIRGGHLWPRLEWEAGLEAGRLEKILLQWSRGATEKMSSGKMAVPLRSTSKEWDKKKKDLGFYNKFSFVTILEFSGEDREIYLKKLANIIVVAGKSKRYRVGRQAADPGCGDVAISSPKAISWQNSFLIREVSFFLFRRSPDWMKPIPSWRVICFIQSLLLEMLISPKK